MGLLISLYSRKEYKTEMVEEGGETTNIKERNNFIHHDSM